MKKSFIYLFVFLTIIFFASCQTDNIKPITKDSSVPIYVQQFKSDSTTECFYKIDSDDYVYLISSNSNQVQEKIYKKSDDGLIFFLGFIIGFAIIMFIFTLFRD